MSKALITGMHGMIAPKIKDNLEKLGIKCIGWDRDIYPEGDPDKTKLYLNVLKPDYVFHLAYGPVEWSETLAKECGDSNIKFIYISTVNVYGITLGPLTTKSEVSPNDEYSKYKYECEKAINKVNKNAYILRLGWQIDSPDVIHPNNMVSFIERTKDKKNELFGNKNSYISASFNSDCSKKIVEISLNKKPGIYLINSNLNLNFTQLLQMVIDKYNLKAKVIEALGETKNWIMIDDDGYIPWGA